MTGKKIDEENFNKPYIRAFWTEREIRIGIWPKTISRWLEVTPFIKDLELEPLKVLFIQSAYKTMFPSHYSLRKD